MPRGRSGIGDRACFREFTRLFDNRSDVLIDGVELAGGYFLARDSGLSQASDRTFLFPFFDIFASPVGEISHPFRVSSSAISPAFDEGWSTPRACSLHRFAGNAIDLQNIVSVESKPGHSVSCTAAADIWISGCIRKRNFCCELIVFADEEDRQLPDAGHVQAFVEGPVVGGSVSEKRDRDIVGLEQLETVSPTTGLQDTGADDTAGPHHADFGRKQMHASPSASGTPRFTSEEFRHQFAWRHSLGQCMSMPPMSAEDDIRWSQMSRNTGGDGFFPDIRMAGAVDETSLMASSQFLFGLSNRLHDTIKRLNDVTGRES